MSGGKYGCSVFPPQAGRVHPTSGSATIISRHSCNPSEKSPQNQDCIGASANLGTVQIDSRAIQFAWQKSRETRGICATYALLGNANHMIPILKRLLALRLLLHDSGSTRSGTNPQRSSFSGTGCGKEIVNRTHLVKDDLRRASLTNLRPNGNRFSFPAICVRALSAGFMTLAMRVHRAMPGVDARPVSDQKG